MTADNPAARVDLEFLRDAEAERDEARAERDALRERVEAVADEPYRGAVMSNERYAEGFHDGWRIAMDHLRAALADPGAS